MKLTILGRFAGILALPESNLLPSLWALRSVNTVTNFSLVTLPALAAILATSLSADAIAAPPPAQNPVPSISSISPSSATVVSSSQKLTINGTNFLAASTITYNGLVHTATFLSSSQLTISLGAGDLAVAGFYPVLVTNPAPGGGPSNTVEFTVKNPVPSITSLSPASVTVGAPAQTLKIIGAKFLKASAATYNGVPHTTNFVSANELTITLTTSDQATAGSFPVRITNPSPGGGTSNTVNFNVLPKDSLTVFITGLQSGTNANVTVTGPGGFSQVLKQTETLTSLSPGTYTISAAIVPAAGAANNTVYIPAVHPLAVIVTATTGTSSSVSYRSLSTIWHPIGPTAIPNAHSCDSPAEASLLASGRIQAFAIDLVNPKIMYAGGGVGTGNSGPYSEAGVYKSTDGGTTWSQADKGLADPAVDALWLDQANPSILLASTWSTGIFRSTDGANSWSKVYSGSTTSIVQVGGVLYAANAAGVLTSTDLGATWQILEPTTSPVRTLAATSGAIYAGLDNGSVITQQGGGPWTTVINAPPNSTAYDVAVNPANPKQAIVALAVSGPVQNLVTNNGGSTWTNWSAPAAGGLCGSGGPGKVVAFDTVNPNLIYSGSGGALYVSTNGGTSWTSVHLLEDLDLLAPLPGMPGAIVVGGDQGIYMSHDSGQTWTSLNGNLPTSILFGLAINQSTILTTIQDFSPTNSFNGGLSWQQLSGAAPAQGEAGTLLINPGNPNYVYVFTISGLQVSSDGGHTYVPSATLSNNKFPVSAGNGDLIAVDAKDPSIVYVAATDGVYKSTDSGMTWTLQTWPVSPPSLVAVDPTNSNNIFVGQLNGGLKVSHSAGQSWAAANLGSAPGAPVTLAVNPANSQIVLLGMDSSPQSGGGILRSSDGGTTFSPANTGISPQTRQTLWQGTIFHIRCEVVGSRLAAAATSTGLYLSSDNGNNWVNIRGNAVPYMFTDLVWSGGYLYASTFGEGVLRLPFPF